jgi:hypothetical protein
VEGEVILFQIENPLGKNGERISRENIPSIIKRRTSHFLLAKDRNT